LASRGDDVNNEEEEKEGEEVRKDGDDVRNGDARELKVGSKRKAQDSAEEEPELVKKSKTEAHSSPEENSKAQTEDLNSLFCANFDTINAGPKVVAGSYEKIVKELEKTAAECLFLSDNVKGKCTLLRVCVL
jgi:hypothetical protein